MVYYLRMKQPQEQQHHQLHPAKSGEQVEDTFELLLRRETEVADVASKVAMHVQDERARQKRYHELSMRDIMVRAVTEWNDIFAEAMSVSSWEDFVSLFNKSADRAFYIGVTLVVLAMVVGLMMVR